MSFLLKLKESIVSFFRPAKETPVAPAVTVPPTVESLIVARSQSIKAGGCVEAERIRQELLANGIALTDSASGTSWKEVQPGVDQVSTPAAPVVNITEVVVSHITVPATKPVVQSAPKKLPAKTVPVNKPKPAAKHGKRSGFKPVAAPAAAPAIVAKSKPAGTKVAPVKQAVKKIAKK